MIPVEITRLAKQASETALNTVEEKDDHSDTEFVAPNDFLGMTLSIRSMMRMMIMI